MFRDEALDFVICALKEESYRKQLAILLPRGDGEGIIQLAASLGFLCSAHDITLALEIRVLRLLRKGRISEGELIQLFGNREWQPVLHGWQAVFSGLPVG